MQVNEVLQEAEENIVKLKYVKLAKRAMSELDPPKNQKKIQIYKKIEKIANNKEDIKKNRNQVMTAIKVALNLNK